MFEKKQLAFTVSATGFQAMVVFLPFFIFLPFFSKKRQTKRQILDFTKKRQTKKRHIPKYKIKTAKKRQKTNTEREKKAKSG